MKKVFTFLALLSFLLTACEKNNNADSSESLETPVTSNTYVSADYNVDDEADTQREAIMLAEGIGVESSDLSEDVTTTSPAETTHVPSSISSEVSTTTKPVTTTTQAVTTSQIITTTPAVTTSATTTPAVTTSATTTTAVTTTTTAQTTSATTTAVIAPTGGFSDYYNNISANSLTQKERELADLVNQYRRSLGLSEMKISKSLTIVARTHVYDSNVNHPENNKDSRGIKGNLHSWSNKGNWTAVVYTPDHYYSSLMWSKPSELTTYKGNGYEISCYSSNTMTASGAFNSWKDSAGHNAVMAGYGAWSQLKVMGIAIEGNYAHIWFGNDDDPAGYF